MGHASICKMDLHRFGADAINLCVFRVHHYFLCLHLGLLKDGYELINQALTLFSSVCGVLHEDVCMCLRLLGRLSYILGDYADVNMVSIQFMTCYLLRFLKQHPHTKFD